MQEARIELLQQMPIFGGVRTETLGILLACCPIASVPSNEFFFREHDQGDSMFVLETGKAAVLKSWRGQDCLLQTLNEGDCFGGDGSNGLWSTPRVRLAVHVLGRVARTQNPGLSHTSQGQVLVAACAPSCTSAVSPTSSRVLHCEHERSIPAQLPASRGPVGSCPAGGRRHAQPRLRAASRCLATSKRTWQSFRSQAVRGESVCRFHGAGGSAPKGPRNGMYRHGNCTNEALAQRRGLAWLLRDARDLLGKL